MILAEDRFKTLNLRLHGADPAQVALAQHLPGVGQHLGTGEHNIQELRQTGEHKMEVATGCKKTRINHRHLNQCLGLISTAFCPMNDERGS